MPCILEWHTCRVKEMDDPLQAEVVENLFAAHLLRICCATASCACLYVPTASVLRSASLQCLPGPCRHEALYRVHHTGEATAQQQHGNPVPHHAVRMAAALCYICSGQHQSCSCLTCWQICAEFQHGTEMMFGRVNSDGWLCAGCTVTYLYSRHIGLFSYEGCVKLLS